MADPSRASGNAAAEGICDHGPLEQGAPLQQCRCRVVRFYNGRHCVGRRRNVGFRTCAVWPVPWNSSLTRRHSPAQPPRLQSSRAAAKAAWQVPRPAPCSRRQRRLLMHTARVRASRQRAPRAAAHTSASVSITASDTAVRVCAIGCSHATGSVGVTIRARARPAGSTVLASSGVLYAYTVAQCACAARLGRVGGGAPVHAQRTPAQQAANRP